MAVSRSLRDPPPLALPELPRRHGRGVLPEAAAGGAGVSLGGGVPRVLRVERVVPHEAAAQLLEPRVHTVHAHVADPPTIPVGLEHADRDRLAEDEVRKRAPRDGAERLAAFGSVDAVDAHVHRLAIDKHLERVAVEDGNDLARERAGLRGRRPAAEGQQEQQDGRRQTARSGHARMVAGTRLPAAHW